MFQSLSTLVTAPLAFVSSLVTDKPKVDVSCDPVFLSKAQVALKKLTEEVDQIGREIEKITK